MDLKLIDDYSRAIKVGAGAPKSPDCPVLIATEDMAAKGAATDPLTGKPVPVRRPDDSKAIREEHFSPAELKKPSQLRRRLTVRLAIWSCGLLGLFIAMGATSGDAQQNVVTLGAICCAAIFVLVPYDAIRLKVAVNMHKEAPL